MRPVACPDKLVLNYGRQLGVSALKTKSDYDMIGSMTNAPRKIGRPRKVNKPELRLVATHAPVDTADLFADTCARLGFSQAEVLRRCINQFIEDHPDAIDTDQRELPLQATG